VFGGVDQHAALTVRLADEVPDYNEVDDQATMILTPITVERP
jgi:hypothetical protein